MSGTTRRGRASAVGKGPRRRPSSRFRRAVARVSATIGGTLLFASALGAGALLHLDTPAFRRLARSVANDVLGNMFVGRTEVGPIEELDLGGLRVASATVFGPRGEEVAKVLDVEVRAPVIRAALAALRGEEILVSLARVGHANVALETGASGRLTLLEAFDPKEAGPPEPEAPAKPSELRLNLPRIRLESAWIHGYLPGEGTTPGPRIDATLHGLEAALLLAPEATSAVLRDLAVVERALLPAELEARLRGSARIPAGHEGEKPAAEGPLAGIEGSVSVAARLGGAQGVAVALDAAARDARISATLSAPHVTPGELAFALGPLAPEPLPLAAPASLRAEVEGPLDALEATLEANVGGLEEPGALLLVEARADLLGPAPVFEADAEIEDLDPTLFLPDAPSTSLDARASARIALGEEGPRGEATLVTEPAVLVMEGGATERIPAVRAEVTFEGDEAHASAHVAATGLPIDATATLREDGSITFRVDAEAESLAAVPQLDGAIEGSARVRASGTFEDGRLDARVRASGESLNPRGVPAEVDSFTLEADLSGKPDALAIDADLGAKGVRAYGHAFETAKIEAEGPLLSPKIDARLEGPVESAFASARLSLEEPSLRDVRVQLERGEEELELRASKVALGPGGPRLEGLRAKGTGIGELEGDLRIAGGEPVGQLKARDVDLGRVASLLGLPTRLRGLANLDVDLEKTREGRRGHVSLELEGGEVAGLSGLSGNISARFRGDAIEAGGFLRVVARPGADCSGTAVELGIVRAELQAKGPLTSPSTFRRATGDVRIEAFADDLGCVAELAPVPIDAIAPVSEVGGELRLALEASREDASAVPTIDLRVATRGLRVLGPLEEQEGPEGIDASRPAWRSEYVDVDVDVAYDGEAREARGRLTLVDAYERAYALASIPAASEAAEALEASEAEPREAGAREKKGILAELTFGAEVDAGAVLASDAPRELLARAPFGARLSVPARALAYLASLPSTARDALPHLAGAAAVDVYAAGTAEAPRAVLLATAADLTAEDPRRAFATPIDASVLGVYDGKKIALDALASSSGRSLAKVHAEAEAPAAVLAAGGAPTGGMLRAELDDFPLAEIGYLAEREVTGHVTARVALDDVGGRVHGSAEIAFPDLQLGPNLFFEKAEIRAELPKPDAAGSATAKLEAELLAHDGGRMDAAVRAQIQHGEGPVPSLAPDGGGEAKVTLSRFRLAAAQPFLLGTVDRLDGLLDGHVRVAWDRAAAMEAGTFDARLSLRSGVLQVPAMGQELREVAFDLTASRPDPGSPPTVVRLTGLRAEAIQGRLVGEGEATLTGARFERARLELRIPEGEALPLVIEGTPLGKAQGSVFLTADRRQDTVDVAVRVPELDLELPASLGRSVEPLEPHPDVVVSHPIAKPEEEEEAPAEPAKETTPIIVRVKLEDIDVEGAGADAKLTGELTIRLETETKVDGTIRVVRGKFEVLDKEFIIEPSTIELQPMDPSNPYLNVSAHYDAPDGTRIIIRYVGNLTPITDEKVKFESNPPLPERQVMALLLFGDASGTLAGGGGPQPGTESGGGSVAGGVGAGLASAQLNAILGSISVLEGLEVELGQGDEGELTTSVSREFGDAFTGTVTYEDADSGVGQGLSVGIDYRLSAHWLVRATVPLANTQQRSPAGDRFGVELLWQNRY